MLDVRMSRCIVQLNADSFCSCIAWTTIGPVGVWELLLKVNPVLGPCTFWALNTLMRFGLGV